MPVSASGRPLGRRRLLGAIVAGLALAGCAGLPPADLVPPVVSVAEVGIDQVGLSDLTLTVTLDLLNPNGYDLPLADVRADLELLGRPLGTGWARETSSMVPAKGRRPVPMVFVVPTTRLPDLLRAFRASDVERIGYRLAGSARWGERGARVPFERSGDLQAWTKLFEGLGPLLPR